MEMLKDSFALMGEVKWIKSKNGIIVAESPWQKNKILSGANKGISLYLDRMTNILTYTGVVSHAQIGDDATPATAGDPGLLNPLVRVSVGAMTRSGLQANFRFFFPDATTPDDTYHEFGMIVDGTPTIGTGVPVNRLVMGSPLVKAPGEDNTILCRITGSV